MDENQKKIIKKTLEFVKKNSETESSHDFWHVYRVWKMSKRIAEKESCDEFVVELAALLHDIGDWKFNDGKEKGDEIAREWLEKNNVNKEAIDKVCEIIVNVSFKGAKVKSKMTTKEAMIVQDADRLDAIGAIGIARAFAYGGYKKRPMYDPNIKPKLHNSFEEYKKSNSPTINHFYEKLLLLKNLMNTETARKIAQERHQFMEEFLNRFFKEWEGRA